MARYSGAVCRQCRRESVKLFLKGARCYSDKCAMDRRKSAPGQHGARRSKLSDYGVQLREKQKLRRIYGILEGQFRRVMAESSRRRGKTGDVLIQNLEMRLDSLIYRLGLSTSRNGARQLVRHNHICVNGRRVNIPSFLVRVGDKVSLGEASREHPGVLSALEFTRQQAFAVPAWLKWEATDMTAEVLAKPQRDEVPLPVREQLVVELYSK